MCGYLFVRVLDVCLCVYVCVCVCMDIEDKTNESGEIY